jgi:Mrp family chromosome partitioning ATPase
LLNLAVTLALRGKTRTAVIDANTTRPAVGDRLGLPPGQGLREVLAGTLSATRGLRPTGLDGLSALTHGQAPAGPSSLGADVIKGLLQELRGRFDWILLDAPCWEHSREVVAVADSSDALYLVVGRDDEEEAGELILDVGRRIARLRGCIITQS